MQQTLGKEDTIDVQALKSLLLQRKTTREHFRFPCTTEQAFNILQAAYIAEVEFRKRKYIEDRNVLMNLEKVAQILTDDDSKFGIILCGVCGNGKTTMLYAFQSALNYLVSTGFLNRDHRIQIIDAKEILHYGKDFGQFKQFRSRNMIGIEDLGREETGVFDYGNLLNPVIDLLEYRYNFQLFTFITTNLVPKNIREKYGNRVADRFNEMFEVVVFENNSYR